MVDSTLKMLDRWDTLAGNGSGVDTCNEMGHLTLEIVARVLFKVEIAGELAHEIVERRAQILGQLLDLFIAGAALQRLAQRLLGVAQRRLRVGNVAVLKADRHRPQPPDDFA